MAELAPNLHKGVPKRTANRRTVAQALHNNSWTQDFKGARTVVGQYCSDKQEKS